MFSHTESSDPFVGLLTYRSRHGVLWQANGSMITPHGIKYEQKENEFELLFDMPKLVSDQKHDSNWDVKDPVQRGYRLEVIHSS